MKDIANSNTESTYAAAAMLVPPPRKKPLVCGEPLAVNLAAMSASQPASKNKMMDVVDVVAVPASGQVPAKYSKFISDKQPALRRFRLLSTKFSIHEPRAETFIPFTSVNLVVTQRTPMPLLFEPAKRESEERSIVCVKSQFLSGSPTQNFYENFATAKPYTGKGGVRPYYSKNSGRTDIDFSTEQHQRIQSNTKIWGKQ